MRILMCRLVIDVKHYYLAHDVNMSRQLWVKHPAVLKHYISLQKLS